ncbi:MAG: substrate-binding domain-containing protein [Phycisphaeraceae bacterium]|nr:substrate-binding domain-containing protein [Phycisphaerales bacterium]MCB9859508.1 substrate-binding domain-containing protein [Phycisphaeraceae bacterium]
MTLAIAFLASVVLTGCYVTPEASVHPSRAPHVVRVMASPVCAPLLIAAEPIFERNHPGVNLELSFGSDEADVDQTDTLIRDINAGADIDLFIAGDALDVQRLMRAPLWTRPWIGNYLVVVRAGPSDLTMGDLFEGTCEVAIGLPRSALGWRTEQTLEHIGALTTVYPRLGRYAGGMHIIERVRWQGGGNWGPDETAGDVLGIVYATDARHIRLRNRGSVRIIEQLPNVPGSPITHTFAPYTPAGEAMTEWLKSALVERMALDMGYVK